MTGLFISFEGVDGVGKTTQVKRLRRYLRDLGRETVVTREPGGTPLGKAIRRMLLEGVVAETAGGKPVSGAAALAAETGAAAKARFVPVDIAARTEALLFAADRAQHVAEVIRPALTRGAVVITDRYIDSSLAYQAGGRELTAYEIRNLSMWATGNLLPDRTYLLDMDPAASHARLRHGTDRMESAGDGFQSRTRQAFLDLAAEDPDRFRVIDAGRSVEDVWRSIQADLDALLAAREDASQSSRNRKGAAR
ncbi:dTMP kinase [Bifidobacterium amazonense]|uniref:Thymidylate kinase n=1 Tax=Bifidobacterium amazonense TaxID=2809027 RepID=A0ABS9VVU4_9BIFI|nr:dTMP kinase [Bifidobacterium amazonense]MCH9276056.1 dTMP kinase [Bifidobacterium amazonense]